LKTISLALLLPCWIAWWYPFLFRAPHFQKRPSITVPWPTRAGLLLEISAFAVSFVFHLPVLQPAGAVRTVLGLVIAVPAVVMAWQAVAHLGKQFRLHAGLYDDHALVRTGPYAIVRHPIYSSLLAMLTANCLLLTRWPWALLAVAIFIAGTEIRVRSEEKLLRSRFPEEFAAYRRQVPAYLPFVR
jgi:protein-S-isoprenylcysteine O-methyltransferase Ste14